MTENARSEDRKRPRLLVVGDAVATTGYATVTRNLCRHLRKDFEIHQLGINYHGDPHGEPWKIYPASVGSDHTGLGRLRHLVRSLQVQVVFLINDPWVLNSYMNELREFQPEVKVVAYCPVDAGPLEGQLVENLATADRLVTYTQFGRRTLEHALEQVRQGHPEVSTPAIDVLPHGVDTRIFHPLAKRQGFKGRCARAIRHLFGDRPDFDEAFIVLNANRNQPRKRIDTTIRGFALFAENKPDNVKLYLHMGVEDVGWNVVRLAERYGVGHRLALTAVEPGMVSISTAGLNMIYNAAAVGLNTSWGEGWGLVSFEHGATGAAQVVPRHSACGELWDGSAQMVEPAMSLLMEGALAEMQIVSPEGVAEALERLYEDPVLLEDLSWAAYRNATRPEYQWANIARRWNRMFRELLGMPVEQDDAAELAEAA